MISIPIPLESANGIYTACAKRVKDGADRAAFQKETQRVIERSELYVKKAAIGQLYLLASEDALNLTNTDLATLYERILVQGAERGTYEKLKSRARFARCPLCGQRDVKTLDHYLPRADFPEFCVTPANLIPSCTDCNKVKHDYVPASYEEQTFHPYFDDWSGVTVLKALPELTHRVYVTFSIGPCSPVPPLWLERAKWHFEKLNLGSLYSEHAAIELVQRKEWFRTTYATGGSTWLRAELVREADSRSRPFPNAWQPALYRGLAASDDFCDGGFEKVEE